MARRRAAAATAPGGAVLPLHLLTKAGLSGPEYRELCREKRQWFLERGIHPGDWSRVYPILQASWAAHGIARPWHRLRVRDEA